MKVTFKYYQQTDADFVVRFLSLFQLYLGSTLLQVDAEPSDTIAALKKKVQESQGHDAEKLNIIFLGMFIFSPMSSHSLIKYRPWP